MCQLKVRYCKGKQISGSLGYRWGDYEKNNLDIYSAIVIMLTVGVHIYSKIIQCHN